MTLNEQVAISARLLKSIPVTDEIKSQLRDVPSPRHDLYIVEIGGTLGDIEIGHFLEPRRQFLSDDPDDTALLHVALSSNPTNSEQKTKSTQHSVKELRANLRSPDIIVTRNEDPLRYSPRGRIAHCAELPTDAVFSNSDISNIYRLPPLRKDSEQIHEYVIGVLNLDDIGQPNTGGDHDSIWHKPVTQASVPDGRLDVGIFGKYDLDDGYMFIHEALDKVPGDDVVLIATTSLPTNYLLTQHALTAIRIDSLPAAIRTEIADELGDPLDAFDLIQIGKWNTDSPSRFLAEFANS